MSIRREATSGSPDFPFPANRHKVSRRCVLVDTLAHKANSNKEVPEPALSLKQCVGVGDGHRDSDCDNDSTCSVKTDAVAGTFKQH